MKTKLSALDIGEGSYRKGVIDCDVYNCMLTSLLHYNGLPLLFAVRLRANINGDFRLGEYISFATVGQMNATGLNVPTRPFSFYVLDQVRHYSKCVSKLKEVDQFVCLCRDRNGKSLNIWWKRILGNGHLYGMVDENDSVTGDNIAHIYPDL